MGDRGEDLKDSIRVTCENFGIEGHLFMYLDDDGKIKMVGEIGADALAPMLPSLLKKLMKAG